MDAPRLKEILNEISRTFRVDVMEGQKVTADLQEEKLSLILTAEEEATAVDASAEKTPQK